jgi:acyl transferase domain-containing protein/acyl carrier protein
MSESDLNNLTNAVAVIGLAGRFPHAANLDEFWQNLKNGREVSTFFSQEELLAAGFDPAQIQDPNYVPVRAVLEGGDLFDAAFFGYSPREAQIIDPQQRVFLECAWEALENAGYDPERYRGAVGVYGGLSMNPYLVNNIYTNPDAAASVGFYQIMLGNDKDFLTTRVSYKLNLKGPSVNVQTACSTSLVAVHMACQSLLSYQCDIVLAGGVSVGSPRVGGYVYQPGMIMSPDGHCRAFDHKAQGIFSGEGVGIVVLKRYEEAMEDRDTIHAIIRGTAINNDGSLKVGYTAPSVDGQTEAILLAQASAGVKPSSITLVEAHGTGTELGDPIEVSALTQAFRTETQEKGFCGIGSVKTNMGHLDAAAGVAGLIKTILALKNETLPPSLNFEKPNPSIDFENSPFYVNTQARAWDTDRLPRRAAVSSFGIGGTNAHAILEEAQPPLPDYQKKRKNQLLLFSARSEAALSAATANFVDWLHKNPAADLADTAYTLQVGRKVFKHRRILVCATPEDAVSALEPLDLKRVVTAQQDAQGHPVAFLFPGQGSQYVDMGRDLYDSEPFFREQVDRCAQILEPHLGLDLRAILYPAPDEVEKAQELIGQTWITQPALFTIEYSLARLWMSWGILPQAMVGHSIGEYVAACLAGVFTLQDALALVAARGKLMQSLPSGSMISIPLPEEEISPLLGKDLSLAVINAPRMCVVSGPHEAIERLQADLAARSIACRRLHTSHAFHSQMMDPILPAFRELVAGVPRNTPTIPYLSNLTGTWVTSEQATSPECWAAHLRSTVRFAQNAEELFKNSLILLEVGPGQTLSSFSRQHPQKPTTQVILSSMRHPQEQVADSAFLTQTLGRLWLTGASPDWEAYHSSERCRRIPLPSYPFERKRHWLEPKTPAAPASQPKDILIKRTDLSSWLYVPSWQRSVWPIPKPSQEPACWLIFQDSFGVAQALADQLKSSGEQVICVVAGDRFEETATLQFTLQPGCEEHYAQLLDALKKHQADPTHIVHLWSLSATPAKDLPGLHGEQSNGFYSLLSLAKALGGSIRKQSVKMLVVTNFLHEVTGGEPLSAGKATLLGPCLTIPQEHPDIECRSLDIQLPLDASRISSALAGHILSEFSGDRSQRVVAHRGAHRWTRSYIPYPVPDSHMGHLKLRSAGVYLITGGYGGIGLTLAGHLAEKFQARLVLLGRSGLPERSSWQEWIDQHGEQHPTSKKIRSVQKMEEQGASVLLLEADVNDEGQMQAALLQAHETYGSLNGVIHAAGVVNDGLIQLKTGQSAAGVLAPKVEGTCILDKMVSADPLDFFLMCSSINTVVGTFGQVDYTAANSFLDAYATMRNQAGEGSRYISVDWGPWQEVGMAVDTPVPENLQRWKEAKLRSGIHPSEGAEILMRLLNAPADQVVVSPVDLHMLLDFAWQQINLPANVAQPEVQSAETGAPPAAGDSKGNRPEVQSSYIPPVSDIEKQMVRIWEDLIGVKPIGTQDNFFELGGHSLMATQILARIRSLYQVEMPLRTFFEVNTIAGLSQRIEAASRTKPGTSSEGPEASDREELVL